MRQLRDESGFTLVEVLLVCTITVILMGGLATILGIGLNTSQRSNSLIASQANVIVALDRLDYEVRCASQATGTVTWCVTGGSLVRYTGSACSGSGLTLVTNVTSATPFSCVSTVGLYPQVKAILTVNTGTTSATASSGTDAMTLENAPLT